MRSLRIGIYCLGNWNIEQSVTRHQQQNSADIKKHYADLLHQILWKGEAKWSKSNWEVVSTENTVILPGYSKGKPSFEALPQVPMEPLPDSYMLPATVSSLLIYILKLST